MPLKVRADSGRVMVAVWDMMAETDGASKGLRLEDDVERKKLGGANDVFLHRGLVSDAKVVMVEWGDDKGPQGAMPLYDLKSKIPAGEKLESEVARAGVSLGRSIPGNSEDSASKTAMAPWK